MKEERQEPVIQHEFVLALQRREQSEDGVQEIEFAVKTTREFTSFGYTVGMDVEHGERAKKFTVNIGGISLPTVSARTSGTAEGSATLPWPSPGDYTLEVLRKGKGIACRIRLTESAVELLEAPAGGFCVVVVGAA